MGKQIMYEHENPWARPAKEKEQKDQKWREPAAIDIDRILYAPELRRLEGVTQVRSPQEDYVYHNRLTHSMKVAQVAMRLAQKLLKDMSEKNFDLNKVKLNVNVCYAAGLAHDLGHPPFGHAAEEEFQDILTGGKYNILNDSFEGNAQTFRIVARNSFRKKRTNSDHLQKQDINNEKEGKEFYRSDGLNLTWRTLAAISKYAWKKNENPSGNPKLVKKWGFYNSEDEYFKYMKEKRYIHPYGEKAQLKQSLEAQIMDWADDITYAVHDLEDYFRGQAIPLEKLKLDTKGEDFDPKDKDDIQMSDEDKRKILLEYRGHLTGTEWVDLFNFVHDHVVKNVYESWSRNPIDVSEMDVLIEFISVRENVPSMAFCGGRDSHDALRFFGSEMITFMQNNTEVNEAPNSNSEYYLEVKKEAQVRAEVLKGIFKYYVVLSPSIAIMQQGQKAIIRGLYNELMTLCTRVADSANGLTDSSAYEQLPTRLKEYLLEALDREKFDGLNKCFGKEAQDKISNNESLTIQGKNYISDQLEVERKRITSRPVIDFICTLTDRQATLLHQRLTGDSIGTLSPYWLNI